ncbi:MAG: integrin alpha [Chloroflexota bacterium]
MNRRFWSFTFALLAIGGYSGLLLRPEAATPDWIAEGNQASAYFGWSVGTAGDVNGDSYVDVIVGAWQYDNGETDGRVFVYHGSAIGLSFIPNWVAIGDQADAYFGGAVGRAGDVNGDGYDDVYVGADGYTNDQEEEGRVYVYYGSAAGLSQTADWIVEGDQEGAAFGHAAGAAGDVNGDGYDDLIVGADDYSNGQEEEGRAFVYYGSAAGLSLIPAWTAESNQAEANFGFAVGSAGDVNGDGYDEVIVGAVHYDHPQPDEGMAFVFYGSAGGPSLTANWAAEGQQVEAWLGHSVGGAGDVNNDGYDDVLVGAYHFSHGQVSEGLVTLYLGSAAGLGRSPNWVAEGNQPQAAFGYSLGRAGDVNNDGFDDVIIGAYHYTWGQREEGRAFVYHGSAVGLRPFANWTGESNQRGATFARSVGTAGDVNGDGYADAIIGAYLYSNGQPEEGRAYAYLGSSGGLRPTGGR